MVKKLLFFVAFLVGSFLSAKADSTNFRFDFRISSSLAGYSRDKLPDTTKQFSANLQNCIYYTSNNFAIGFGTGIENSMYRVNDKKSFYRIYQAPVFLSFKFISDDNRFHFFQNAGIAMPIAGTLQNISPGYYFQSGIGVGGQHLKFEVSYKIITLNYLKGPMRNNNLTFGLSYSIY